MDDLYRLAMPFYLVPPHFVYWGCVDFYRILLVVVVILVSVL